MVLAKKSQKYRLMEQDRKPRINPWMYRYLSFDKGGKNIQWGKTASSIMVLGKIDSYMEKNEIRTLPNTIHNDKLKMD